MQNIVTFVFFMLVTGTGGLVTLTSSVAVTGQPVLVLSAGGAKSRESLVAQSGGRLIGLSTAPLASLAVSDDPHFLPRLRASGAVMVLDGRAFSSLCGGLS
ncbi:hypothetical protein ACOI1H_08985 [Loktanella sp. DJP18]|uniref:hypothetical protein n=1 Tax=Loktanella sp. DJP18 TaxID=3409788 RepID=UPI003BB5BCAC